VKLPSCSWYWRSFTCDNNFSLLFLFCVSLDAFFFGIQTPSSSFIKPRFSLSTFASLFIIQSIFVFSWTLAIFESKSQLQNSARWVWGWGVSIFDFEPSKGSISWDGTDSCNEWASSSLFWSSSICVVLPTIIWRFWSVIDFDWFNFCLRASFCPSASSSAFCKEYISFLRSTTLSSDSMLDFSSSE